MLITNCWRLYCTHNHGTQSQNYHCNGKSEFRSNVADFQCVVVDSIIFCANPCFWFLYDDRSAYTEITRKNYIGPVPTQYSVVLLAICALVHRTPVTPPRKTFKAILVFLRLSLYCQEFKNSFGTDGQTSGRTDRIRIQLRSVRTAA